MAITLKQFTEQVTNGKYEQTVTKPFKAFTIYALIILACSIPVYYLVVDFIWLDELDEHNHIVKERIEYSFNNAQIEENRLNSLLKIGESYNPAPH